jgi:CRP/FNR family transcriptional regulator, cyclic AMP receptor protein
MVDLMLFRHSETVKFHAGQIIFRAEETGTQMYVVSEGEVEVRIGHHILDIVGPGSIVGEMALIDQGPRSATAVAKTDCRLVAIDQSRFEFLVQQTPFFSLAVMKVMADRLRRTNARVTASHQA